MTIAFSVNGSIDPIAMYAAVLSTVIAVWEFIKWRGRNAIKMMCTPNMLFFPSRDKQKYIVVKVINRGDRPTTITHMLGYHWKSRLERLLDRKKRKANAFIVNSDNVPKVIQPGEEWMGQALQNSEIEKMASEGCLYMGVIHSMGNKEILRRVKIQPLANKVTTE
jgi:hypothetical protein